MRRRTFSAEFKAKIVLEVLKGEKEISVIASSAYYKAKEPSETELFAKNAIDKMHTDHPAWGSRQLSKQLKRLGFDIGRLKTRRFMHEMDIHTIYPKPNLSKPAKGHKIYPYLLRNANIIRSGQSIYRARIH